MGNKVCQNKEKVKDLVTIQNYNDKIEMQRRANNLSDNPAFEWFYLNVALSEKAFNARVKLENFMFSDPKFIELLFA